jgi:kynureninase
MKVYLDNNATTIVDPHVFEEMEPYFVQRYGNPNSLHLFASETHPALKDAMQKIYAGIHAPKEDSVVITSCATESNNWVLKSIYFQYILTGRKNHIIVSEVEHPSVIATAKFIESMGCRVTYLPINSEGLIDAQSVRDNITDKTAIISYYLKNIPKKTRLIMIGDRYTDRIAASDNAIPFIGCSFGHAGVKEISGSKWIAEKFTDIPALIRKIEKQNKFEK